MNRVLLQRAVHIVGVLLCIVALVLVANGSEIKSLIAGVIAAAGLAANAYGVWKPNTWLSF